ncbi:beta-galactosidase 7-like protein [Trifolium pratense]|uniref:Beta-galactosidase n=1 Tax=Trifolium pratense TaxID=57577 RepID=A0A2K3L6I3_TRIPR|nr:beta-galactosidase 7-like protein [Trifolium pratense]PNY01818.1 beta-galactosidase 7-like protein [Trifolium pratense]PNY07251.1 beta-galactosidase 7-like protein [Trifolium pratense]
MSYSSFTSILLFNLILLYSCFAIDVDYDSKALIINGERRLIFSGAIHYPRSTVEMWPDLIQKAKDGGLDAIETYIFWDVHEPVQREYNFSGNLDFVKFFKLIQEAGLYGIIRIGPYVCAEWNYGGFPLWLHNMSGIKLRTDNPVYKNEMQIFTTKIVDVAKEANLFASQGGPIILAQIENEYGDIMSHYNDSGKVYINWCAQMALAQKIGVPWIMCQQPDAPQPIINTCNGHYCHNFQPNNPKSPKMFTENWIGWFQKWGERVPHRTAQDSAFSVARFFQNGGVLNNYYMYHGGTNFGRTSGGPYITTSYDYDAPIDEYGNLNQPKWGHLKDLHASIKLGEKVLTNYSTRNDKDLGNGITLTTYTNSTGARFCFLNNNDTNNDANVDLQNDGKYFVPAWSVTILNGCNQEVFNTAKVNSQTSIMVKKSDDDNKLTWEWKMEPKKDTMLGNGSPKAYQLLEQKEVTSDASDYLWYMTSVDINDTSIWSNATLRVNTMGHTLHGYVNRRYVGYQFSQTGNQFTYEKQVSLKNGTNIITLLSATVGLANYGAWFDEIKVGISGGPVQLIGKNNVTMDLSTNLWSYKVGLNGERRRLYDSQSQPQPHGASWRAIPIGQPMIWYKAEFKSPLGTNPVVVDLQGLGKGHAWVNGHSIGRYWSSWITPSDGCSNTCDYRGNYTPEKCKTNCGNPSQRWYHVPRSFMNDGLNTLVLFEEIGGNPLSVQFQTVTTGTVCANVYEGKQLELACQSGQVISQIQFASFGNPEGQCGSFKKGSWDATNSQAVMEAACVGTNSCGFSVTKEMFGGATGANNSSIARLAVQVTC